MNIAMTGNVFPVAYDMAYGGERRILYLSQDLTKLGHNVYLFGTEGSRVPDGAVKDYIPVPPMIKGRDVYFEAVQAYTKRTGIEFDVYQCNYFTNNWVPETMTTFPAYCESTWNRWCHAHWQLKEKPFNVISSSKFLQATFREVGVETTVINHGHPKELYTPQYDHDGYAVWIGKIEKGKAPDLAAMLALVAGLKIVIMGPPYHCGWFQEQMLPLIDNEKVFWVRGVDDEMKQRIMSRAKVFIYSNSNKWREHFGQVIVEAIAMGVPVLGFNKINYDCAIKTDELIIDGQHGFLLEYNDSEDHDEILSKGLPLLARIDEIDRHECRKYFEKRFTSHLMARRYEWLYKEAIAGKKFGAAEIPI